MQCPLLIDYVRTCEEKIGSIPVNTFDYCMDDNYVNCPFYKVINKIGVFCEHILNCPVYKYFSIAEFKKFTEICDKFCLSENNVNCARYKIKKSGKVPPATLLPDGTSL